MTARRAGAVVLIALGMALLLVFGWARSESSDGRGTVSGSASSRSYAVELTVSAEGPAEVAVYRHDGAPVRFPAVTLEPAMPQMGHAIPAVAAEPVGPGRFATHGALVDMPGQWEVLVRLGAQSDAEFVIVPLVV